MEDRALTTCDSRNAPSTFNNKSCHPLVAFTGYLLTAEEGSQRCLTALDGVHFFLARAVGWDMCLSTPERGNRLNSC